MDKRIVPLSDGAKIYTESKLGSKDKSTFVYVHGGPGNGCWDFRYMAMKIADLCNVLIFDERGCLRSDSIKNNFNSEMLVDDIEELRKLFDIDRMILCGHSYGGTLIVRYALKYPENIEKLIYICPSFGMLESLKNVYRCAAKVSSCTKEEAIFIKETLTDDVTFETLYQGLGNLSNKTRDEAYGMEEVPAHIRKVNTLDYPEEEWARKAGAVTAFLFSEDEVTHDYTIDLPNIKIPSLLIAGELDPVCTPSQIQAFSQEAHNKVVTIKGAGHMPYQDCHADEIYEVIRGYLAELTDSI
mgnify:CR=1 FL=1